MIDTILWIRRGLALVAMMCAAQGALAQTDANTDKTDDQRIYVYGNSLVHHLTDSDETTVPHWMAVLAEAAGTELRLDGQWGFLRDFAESGRPSANWRLQDVERAWTRAYRNFGDVGWDTVLITPANFIQYRAPELPYEDSNPSNASPLSATLAVIDNIEGRLQDAAPVRYAIYEGWAYMGNQIDSFPPDAEQMVRYLRHNTGAYRDWFDTYMAQLRAARPEVQIDLVPVATVLTQLLDGGVLEGIPSDVLFTDDAPHGTATLYLLAGAITYVTLFEAELPLAVALPATIDPDVRTYWEAVRDEIHRLVLRPIEAEKKRIQLAQSGLSAAQDSAASLAGLGLANPALSMGLSEVKDWSTQHPFLNRMKTARPWVGHVDGRWGALNFEDLQDLGLVDDQGWIWGLPEDIEAIETVLFTDQPEESTGLAGRYRVTWTGQGAIEVTGRARVVREEANTIWFDYTPGEGLVGLRISNPDPDLSGDYIRDIEVLAMVHIPLARAGMIFNPDWLNVVDDLRQVRFMDWMQTNASTQSAWAARPATQDFTYSWRGVPVEVMVALANQIGADPWFNMPHLAEPDYITRFATYVRDHLDPELVAHVEYSNELWNWGFEQAQWVLREGEARWGNGSNVQMQFAGMKAAEMAQIWGDVYGDDADTRLRRVIAVHTGWPGYEDDLLKAPLWQAEGHPAPVDLFEAYAVTGYFGVSLGVEDGAEMVRGWLQEARATAEAAGAAEGLQRAALRSFVQARRHDGVFAKAAEALRTGDLRQMTEEYLPYHAERARAEGLDLLMYEGGSHVVGVGEEANDDALTDMFTAFSTSDELAEVYSEMLAAWRALGGQGFNGYSDVGRPSKWGSWGHLRHLWDKSPRHETLTAYNLEGAHWTEARTKDAFLHGGIYLGSDGRDRLEGTGKRDVLLGGDGNDILVARGRGDLLHGGGGLDRVLLPGTRADYRWTQEGDRVRVTAEGRDYLLTEIEAVAFEDAPALVLPLSGLL
ncbi:calcium-binding protein [Shimia sp. MMG029]|uniref:calcium-binding protein n=1 Tax=Shimia sp. MMG029 TaxID=3021978 RepID=UPI0022FDC19B|nr:calcium-binding protein [Shimia sp. MMG029]MDA5558623.1 calcium-binding protein [Shimia sp. MMG029]